jgi:signal peptidase I
MRDKGDAAASDPSRGSQPENKQPGTAQSASGRARTEGERMDDGSGRQESAGPAASATDGPSSEPDGPEATNAAADEETPADSPSSESGTPAAAATKAKAKGKPGGKRRSFWKELPVLIVVALVLALVIKTYALQAFYIPSGSMENTLEIGDRVLINKLVYDFRGIHRGDVIVFNGAGSWDTDLAAPSTNPVSRFFTNIGQMIGVEHGEDDYVKRVIGLPGDHVACCNAQGQITVNGVALSETSYLYPGNAPSEERFSITVPPGRLWVMGDHRAISYDSRGHMGDPGGGTIPESAVLGRVFVRIWPPSRWGFISIPSTFNQPKLNEALGGSLGATLSASTGKIASLASPGLPVELGLAGAVPLTLLQRLRRRRS